MKHWEQSADEANGVGRGENEIKFFTTNFHELGDRVLNHGEKGIRHSLLDNASTVTFTDAKFMLVTCSAFVNYVKGKVAELGIKIKKTV
jgi:hypothetical protein